MEAEATACQSGDAVRPALWTPGFRAVLAAQVCVGYALSSFFLLPKFLGQELGAGPAEIGRVMAAERVATFLCMPLMGAAVDRHGRRRFLTSGALILTATSLLFTAVDAVGPLIYALRAAQGVGFAMAFAAAAAAAVDEAPPERLGEAIGLFGLTMLSMNAAAPALVEWIASGPGWAWGFGSAAGAAALGGLLSRRLPGAASGGPEPVPGLGQVARRPALLRIAVTVALIGVAFSALFVFHQPLAAELGIEAVRSFFIAYTAAALCARLGLGRQIDRIGRRRVALLAMALYAGVVLSGRAIGTLGLAPVGAGLGVAHGLWYPSLNALAVESVGPRERGKVMAIFQAAFNLGWAGGAFGLGLLAEARGYPAVFSAAGSAALLALLAFALSPEGRPPARSRA